MILISFWAEVPVPRHGVVAAVVVVVVATLLQHGAARLGPLASSHSLVGGVRALPQGQCSAKYYSDFVPK